MASETGSQKYKFASKYLEYLNQHNRRLKKGPELAPADGAGLLNGAKFHGRTTPLRGKGTPPADDRQVNTLYARRPVAGHSFTPTDVLLIRRPATAEPAGSCFRPSRRVLHSSLRSSLVGTAAIVSDPLVNPRPSRARGSASPDITLDASRRNVFSSGLGAEASWDSATGAGLRGFHVMGRPATADSILRHRYSDPDTEAAPALLDGRRTASPHTATFDALISREVFAGAFDDYCLNKSHALYGSGRMRRT